MAKQRSDGTSVEVYDMISVANGAVIGSPRNAPGEKSG